VLKVAELEEQMVEEEGCDVILETGLTVRVMVLVFAATPQRPVATPL
jgi:hypothetical protein